MRISPEFKKDLEEELKRRTEVLRISLQKSLQEAYDTGDGAHDNFLIQNASEAFELNERRITEITNILSEVQVVVKEYSGLVQLGSRVKIKNLSNSTIKHFVIVNEIETDISQGKISFSSPIGKSLRGKKLHDEFTITTASGTVQYKIQEIL